MSDMGDLTAPFPLQQVPFVDSRGVISLPWLMLLQQLQRRTGGDLGTSTGDVDAEIIGLETTSTPLFGNTNSDVLAQEFITAPTSSQPDSSLFSDITAPTLSDIVRDILARELTMPTPAQGTDPLAQEIAQAFAPVVIDVVREVLARETVFAAPQGQQPLSEMTFAPQILNNSAAAPILVTGASPITIYARSLQTLSLDGGTITGVTYQRGTWSRSLPTTTALIAMSPGEIVTVTYTVLPTLYVLQR